jgi:hypothetical protein
MTSRCSRSAPHKRPDLLDSLADFLARLKNWQVYSTREVESFARAKYRGESDFLPMDWRFVALANYESVSVTADSDWLSKTSSSPGSGRNLSVARLSCSLGWTNLLESGKSMNGLSGLRTGRRIECRRSFAATGKRVMYKEQPCLIACENSAADAPAKRSAELHFGICSSFGFRRRLDLSVHRR